jgi:sec-independent protein translocase protein TatA
MPGTTEILIIVGVVVLLFGAGQIPKFARNIGKAKREFERGLRDGASGADDDDDDDEDSSASSKRSREKESSGKKE